MKKIEIINQWDIARIFQELEQGNMRIPRFQREYVWERSKIVKLLNSIAKSYPIGSFFLWETDTSMEALVRDVEELGFPAKPEGKRFMFILDGQQRITSLYVALNGKSLHGIDYSTICYNLDRREFTIPRLKTEQHNVPVWKIWNEDACMELVMEYTLKGDTGRAHAQAIMQCKNMLKTYPVSVIMSRDMEVDEVINIFERINQGGKRLSLFDLVNAAAWDEDFDLREQIDKFWSEPNVRSWGWIGYEIYAQALSLNLKGDCSKLVQLKLTAEECKSVWERTKECIRVTIDYLKRLGAQQLTFLPYANMIPVVQYYLYKGNYNGIQAQHKQLIEDWFWTVTFSKRYSSSTLTRMNEDVKWIDRMLAGDTTSRIFPITLTVDDLRWVRMNHASVVKNGVLCLLAKNHPVDFDNGESVTIDKTHASRSNSKENHHFFPFSLHKSFDISMSDANCVLNFAFISKRLNLSISNKYPSVYLSEFAAVNPDMAQHLASHYITPVALSAAMNNDFDAFIAERARVLMELIDQVCKRHSATVAAQEDDYDDMDDDSIPDEEYNHED
jgi:hypothetical protein